MSDIGGGWLSWAWLLTKAVSCPQINLHWQLHLQCNQGNKKIYTFLSITLMDAFAARPYSWLMTCCPLGPPDPFLPVDPFLSQMNPSLCWYPGLFRSRCKTPRWLLLNFRGSSVKSLWEIVSKALLQHRTATALPFPTASTTSAQEANFGQALAA